MANDFDDIEARVSGWSAARSLLERFGSEFGAISKHSFQPAEGDRLYHARSSGASVAQIRGKWRTGEDSNPRPLDS
jgi:hypothetical protein